MNKKSIEAFVYALVLALGSFACLFAFVVIMAQFELSMVLISGACGVFPQFFMVLLCVLITFEAVWSVHTMRCLSNYHLKHGKGAFE